MQLIVQRFRQRGISLFYIRKYWRFLYVALTFISYSVLIFSLSHVTVLFIMSVYLTKFEVSGNLITWGAKPVPCLYVYSTKFKRKSICRNLWVVMHTEIRHLVFFLFLLCKLYPCQLTKPMMASIVTLSRGMSGVSFNFTPNSNWRYQEGGTVVHHKPLQV